MKELMYRDLRRETDPAILDFQTTDDIKSTPEQVLGQERALRAIDFGLHIKSPGFNLYVAGAMGTGKATVIQKAVEEMAGREPAPADLCYLYNFQNKDEPRAVKLPGGVGCVFKQDMENFIKGLGEQISKAFGSDEYERHKKEIFSKFEEQKTSMNAELEEFARSHNFSVQRAMGGFMVVPLKGGRGDGERGDQLLSGEEYENLPRGRREELKKAQGAVSEKLSEVIRQLARLEKEIANEFKNLDEKIGLNTIDHLIEELKGKYSSHAPIKEHLDQVRTDIIQNIQELKKEPENQPMALLMPRGASKEDILHKYQVNLLVNNCGSRHAPVVFENNPTYYNLIGYMEYRAQMGALLTDFTMIKPGAVHRANGGYLILQAEELLKNYFAWDALKKILRFKKAKIEEIYIRYGFAPTTGLKPQPLEIDLKVIILGNPLFYRLLYMYDEEFRRLFKVKADFDTVTRRDEDMVRGYAAWIAQKIQEENLLPFHREAVAKVIDFGSRMVSHKEKLSVRFMDVLDLMREADLWARRDSGGMVEGRHVVKAVNEKTYRSNMIEEKIRDMIEEKTIFIDTEGSKVGQINGLSVLDAGDYAFGMPSRITARTYMGRGNILNIERAAKLSGPIHSKGVLILSSYLGEKFAQDKPLALSASIGFEQSYEGVEGDSASSTELYCLLSSLSEVPLRQDIAVTGSVDQRGRVQPIGGVNQKIEGFYEVCKVMGMTGKQGVMIPESNVKHLMLKEEVVEAVQQGKFHIYSVSTIDEGIEVLTGVKAGECHDGEYPPGSVNYRVNEKLKQYAKTGARFGRGKLEERDQTHAKRFKTP